MASNGPNIVALDQENHGLVAVINGAPPRPFDPVADVGLLPEGGGVVVADVNAWAVRNPLSQAQYCWGSAEDLDAFLRELHRLDYHPRAISNRFANTLYLRAGLSQAEAVIALADHVHDRVADGGATGTLWCGSCDHHGSFDGGRPVRISAGGTVDRSYGQRAVVVEDFLTLQNQLLYDTPFVEAAIGVVWDATSRTERDLLNLKKTRREEKNPNRVTAIAVCTHDPWTGQLRVHDGAPWGTGFIRRRVIGLNGTMCGSGPRTAGNPMRAVLRSLGRGRNPAVLNDLDRAVGTAIAALRAHGPLPAA